MSPTLELIGAIIAGITSIVGAYLAYKGKKDSDLSKQLKKNKEAFIRAKIKETEARLVAAMESDITSVPLLRKTLNHYRGQLKKYVALAVIPLFMLCGCASNKQYMVIGERIFTPEPGDVITVPQLKNPAKQWYLIDDKAMLDVLGVDKPVLPETIIGVKNE